MEVRQGSEEDDDINVVTEVDPDEGEESEVGGCDAGVDVV